MSLISVNMATPFKENIYILPNPRSIESKDTWDNNRKYVAIKVTELVLATAGIVLFALGVNATKSTIQDMLISVCFGAFIIYPLLFLVLSLMVKKRNYDLLAVNIVATIAVLTTGSVIMGSWWDFEKIMDTVEDSQPETIVLEVQESATLKFISSLTCFLNALMYLCETLLIVLEQRGYI